MPSRLGMSIIEVVVTVAIVAILVAVLTPSIVGMVSRGDAPAIRTNVNALRAAIATFTTDVRQFPRAISQLSTHGTVPEGVDIHGNRFTMRARGPYIENGLGYVEVVPGVLRVTAFRRKGSAPGLDENDCPGQIVGILEPLGGSELRLDALSALEEALGDDDETAMAPLRGRVRWTEIASGPLPGSAVVCLHPLSDL